jgi:adenylosuccinate synthase
LILPSHRLLDAVYEKSKGKLKIGSTLKGIGPTYTDKIARQGIRIGELKNDNFQEKYVALKEKHQRIVDSYNYDITEFKIDGLDFETYENRWFESIQTIRQFSHIDSEHYINDKLRQGKKVLAEGAQGTLLDIDFGSYPFVTSSNTICAGVCSGLGIAPSKVGKVFGVFKAYCTRVGSGPFPTELFDADGTLMRDEGHEYGSTTGRPRRCGWLDLVALNYAIMLNGVTDLIMTKGDVLGSFENIKACTKYKLGEELLDHIPFENEDVEPSYEVLPGWNTDLTQLSDEKDFPENLAKYIDYIEKSTGTPISIVSVGPDRKQTILR